MPKNCQTSIENVINKNIIRLLIFLLVIVAFFRTTQLTDVNANALAQFAHNINIVQDFSPAVIAQKGVTVLTVTISNPNAYDLTGATFSEDLTTGGTQPGLSIADPSNLNSTCGGTATGNKGTTTLSLVNGVVAANSSCTISLNLNSSVSGNLTISIPSGGLTGTVNSGTAGNSSQADATLNVATFDFPAEINKSFTPIEISPGDTSRLRVEIFNSNSFILENAAWTDNLTGVQPGLIIANPPNVATNCGGNVVNGSGSPISAGDTVLALNSGSVPAEVASTPGSCYVEVDVTTTTSGNLINLIPPGTLSATGNGGSGSVSIGNTSEARATLEVDTIIPPSITKSFGSNTIWVGQPTSLTIQIKNNDTAHALSQVALSDYLNDPAPYNIQIASVPSTPLSHCGSGVLTANVGDNSLAISGAGIAAGDTCQITVNVTSNTAGIYTNTIAASAIQTKQGVTNASPASAPLNVQAVGITKAFNPTAIQAGEVSNLTITLKNPTTTSYTGVNLKDVMPGTILDLVPGSAATTCGSGAASIISTNRSNDTVSLTGGTIGTGNYTTPGSCTITVQVTTDTSAQTSAQTNIILANTLQTDQNITNILPTNASLNIQALSVGIAKSFSPVSFQQGGTTHINITLQNRTSSNITVSNLTDSLPTGLAPLTPDSAGTDCSGGAAVSTVSPAALTLSGGIIPPGTVNSPGTCNFWVDVTSNGSSFPATITNTINPNALTTVEGPTDLYGVSQSVFVYKTGLGMTGSKTFSPSSIAAGGNSLLQIRLRAPDDKDLDGVNVTDTLPGNVTVSNSSPASTSGCGASADLSASTGANVITLSNGSIARSSNCQINVYVTSALSGVYTNTLHPADITDTQGQTIPGNVTATLTVSHMTISKAFYPNIISPNGLSTLTIILSNTNPASLSGATLLDNLNTLGGTDITVAPTPNAGTNCGSGVITAAQGTQTISMSNGTVPAQVSGVPGICTIHVDVKAAGTFTTLPTTRNNTLYRTNVAGTINGVGTVINPVADASASLTITNLTLGVVKGFNPLTVFGGSSSTLSVQLNNPNNTILTGIAFSDTMPAGMYIADPANPSTGTCGGTLTATPGSQTFTFSGGVLNASKVCTLTLNTTMNVNGNRTNTIAAQSVSSFNGAKNPQAAQASLTNLPGISISKFFTPNSIVLGQTSVLTLRIKNTGNVKLNNINMVDNLPSGITILASPAPTNACNGTLTADTGTSLVELKGGSLVAGPNTTCDIVLTVSGAAAGNFTNTIAKSSLTTDEGATNTEPASDTLTISSAPDLQLEKTVDLTHSILASSLPFKVGDTIAYNMIATNSGNVPLHNVVINDAEAGVTFGTCDQASPVTLTSGQSLTCSATHVVTAADVTNGHFDNTASATSTETNPVTKLETVPIGQTYALDIKKINVSNGAHHLGDTINYSITVTNIGNGSLNNVTVSDPNAVIGACTPAQPVTLNSGNILTCPASHVVTVTDVNAGSLVNTATVTSDNTTPISDSVTVPIQQNPGLKIFKQVTSTGPYISGSTITYDISAVNSGDQTLHNVIITDSDPGVTMGTCSPVQGSQLAKGEIMSCPASHVVTDGDMTSGGYTNTASATSNEAGPVTDSVTVVTRVPTIQLVKTGTLHTDITGPTDRADAGDKITYAFTIKNTGQVTLTNISLTDIVGGITINGGPTIASLDVGASDSSTFTGVYTLTQADIDAGTFSNTATATGYPPVGSPVSDTASDTKTNLAVPQLTLVKTLTNSSNYKNVGETLNYSYSLTNSGNVTLTGNGSGGVFNITDNFMGSPLGTPFTCGTAISLAPGASVNCSNSYAVTQADIDNGSVTNTANGDGKYGSTDVPSNTATQTAHADQTLALTLVKSIDGSTSPIPYTAVGGKIIYDYVLTNSGNVTLVGSGGTGTPFTISDDHFTGAITCGTATSLAPGAATSCTATYTLTQTDLDNSPPSPYVTNKATGHGDFGATAVTSNQASQTVSGTQIPGLTLTKSFTSGNPYTTAGGTINYNYVLKNSGNVTLTGLGTGGVFTVTDDKVTVTCPTGTTSLASGASVTCTGGYTLLQSDLNSGSVTNIAIAHAQFNASPVDSSQQTLTATATQTKSLTLTKSTTSGDPYSTPGTVIQYSYLLKNTGNVTLAGTGSSGEFTVTDDKVTVTCPVTPTSLDPNDTITCTSSSAPVTQADIDGGSITNHATAHSKFNSTQVDSTQVTKTVNATQTKTLTLVKTLTTLTNYKTVGDVLNYSYSLTNSGNVTLTGNGTGGVFTITDNFMGTPKGTAFACGSATSMAPGDSVSCTNSYTVTQADLDNGTVTNTANGHGKFGAATINSNSASQTSHADQTFTMTLVKSIDSSTSPNPYTTVGGIVVYKYVLTNTGNVTLAGAGGSGTKFTIKDDHLGSPLNTAFNCGSATSLAPLASVNCTANYSLTQADLDNNPPSPFVTNHATGQAKFGSTAVVSNQDTTTIYGTQTPGLTLTKSFASGNPYTTAGAKITYNYVLKNSGNVTLSGTGTSGEFTVTDDTVAVTCPVGTKTLASNATVTCTASYTLTQADVNNGSITNKATAHAQFNSSPVNSLQQTLTASATQTKSLTLTKNADKSSYSALGTVITYTYLLTNSGNVTLSGTGSSGEFTVSDDEETVTCPLTPTSLDPGNTVTCSASHTINQTDLDNGSITNHATAHSKFGATTVDSSQATKTINAAQTNSLSLVKTRTSSATYNVVGNVVTYDYTLSNNGNVTLVGNGTGGLFTITDNYIGSPKSTPFTCGLATKMIPGDSVSCSNSYTITQADLDSGVVTNIAYGHGKFGLTPVDSASATATASAIQTEQLTLVKSIDVSTNPNPYNAVGGTVVYHYDLTNTGNVTLIGSGGTGTPFTITDDHIGSPKGTAFSCGAATSLIPGAETSCTATYTLTQADLDNNPPSPFVTNQASGHGKFGGSKVDSALANQTISGTQIKQLTLTKSFASGNPYTTAGSQINYNYVLKNTGNVTLSGAGTGGIFTVTDDKVTVTCPGGITSLASGASVTCTGSYTVNQTDVNNGSVINKATAHSKFNSTPVDSTEQTLTAIATQTQSLTLNKSADKSSYNTLGTVINYSYLLKNTGNVTLTGTGSSGEFRVTDDKVTVSCPLTPTSLDPNNTITCSASHAIDQTDLDNGSLTNTARAHALFGLSTFVDSNQSSVTLSGAQTPGLTLAKSITAGNPFNLSGNEIDYSYTLTNSGNVTLTGNGTGNVFTINDDQIGTPKNTPFTCGSANSLPPLSSVTCSTTYTVTQSDLNNGTVTNHATGHGLFGVTAVDSPQVSQTATGTQNKKLTLVKTITSGGQYTKAGNQINYNYQLTNDGNVTLTGNGTGGRFTITDNQLGSPKNTAFICSAVGTSLNPGGSLNCTASYTVTQADLDNGSVVNVANGHALFGSIQVDSNSDTKTASATQNKSLTLLKTITSGSPFTNVGNKINYSYLLTNNGNITLTGTGASGEFIVTDNKASVTCPTTPTTLLPADTVTCTASYTITQPDLDNGNVTNIATATAKDPSSHAVNSNQSSQTANASQSKSLTLEKTISSGASFNAAGAIVKYSYKLTNNSNVTLAGSGGLGTQFTITDDQVGSPKGTAFTCGTDTTLAPGAFITCTTDYTVTQADMDRGTVINHANGHGWFGGTIIDSNQGSQTATSNQSQGLTLTKTIQSGDPYIKAGDVITYNYELANNGNVTLTGNNSDGKFTITDDHIGNPVKTPFVCGVQTSLAPGEKVSCQADYLVTLADISNESVTNEANGHGVFGSNPVTTNQASKTANVKRGEISGVVYYDIDGSQTQDTGEPGISGVKISLYDSTRTNLLNTTTTGAQGIYTFTGLLPRTYVVVEDNPIDYLSTTPDSVTITIAPNETKKIDFGDNQLTGLSTNNITGTVYDDANNNGVFDNAESVLPNVTITLYDQNGAEVATTTSGADGKYNFDRLAPGQYTVIETNLPGYISTTLNQESVILLSGTTAEVDYGDLLSVGATIIDPAVTKFGNPTSAKVGDLVYYTITVGNNGNANALNVVLSDTKPSFLDILNVKITPDKSFPVNILGNKLTINFGTVTPSDVYTVTVVTKVNKEGIPPGGENVAAITTDSTSDPIFNDTSSVPLGIYTVSEGGGLLETGFAPGQISQVPAMPDRFYNTDSNLTIEIPALDLNTTIVGLPKTGNTWNMTWLGNQLGYLDGTAFPTFPGNSVITGHVYGADGLPGPLVNLGKMKWGDKIILRGFGNKYTYEVRNIYTTDPNDTTAFKHENFAWVTLVTCKDYNETTKTYDHRTVVKAVLVKTEPN